MKRILSYLILIALLPLAASAQTTQQTEQLFKWFKKAASFDYRYPREKVYVHFDNSAYMENDSIWYKAYVVRASSLTPTNLSRVLYVELLNADGQLMEQQILPIDSLGQADGCFSLQLPVRAGYYEVRAFTREMVNWGEAACFSRVFPVFAAKQTSKKDVQAGDFAAEQLELPMPEPHDKTTLGNPRPYQLKETKERRLAFYPEGGHRGKGLAQQMAFTLTDGRGNPVDDTLQVYDDQGLLLAEASTEHEGMGTLSLPAFAGKGYAQVKGQKERYHLPEPKADYVLHADVDQEGLNIDVNATDEAIAQGKLLGLAIMNRERVCYFDTLTAAAGGTQFTLPLRALRAGVNRVELYDTEGHGLASRLVWYMPTAESVPQAQLTVKQNKREYSAFEPAVLTFELKDSKGQPVSTTLSVAVRDESGNIVNDEDSGIKADLLLSSEVRGYVHNPASYFAKDDAAHRRMLDLLLMVQGWTANTFDVMCDADTFRLKQPIEDRLILRGTMYKLGGHKLKPMPNHNISMKMYSLTGGAFEGTTRTDSEGHFAFESNVDYEGKFIAQFTGTNDEGERQWSRLTIDRWFAPQPRAFRGPELNVSLYTPGANGTTLTGRSEPEIFEWKDTIPNRRVTMLGEAKVTVKNKYRGFTGNRYTWLGGEKTGMRRATKYYNIEREVERYKDMGKDPGEIFSFIGILDNATTSSFIDYADINPTITNDGSAQQTDDDNQEWRRSTSNAPQFPTSQGERKSRVQYQGRDIKAYVNNESYDDLVLRMPELYANMRAEEIKSASIVTAGLADDALTGTTSNRSKSHYRMYLYEQPKFYRTHSTKKGVERRNIEGFTPLVEFYHPDYRGLDMPTDKDVRRTLTWEPSLRTDAQGRASLIFYTNARESQRLDISVRGLTRKGEMVE